MSKDTLDSISKIVATIFYLIVISVTIYGQILPYLNDFWKGFMLGALIVFFSMLVFNFYQTRRTKTTVKAILTEPTVPVSSPKIETKAIASQTTVAQHTRRIDGIAGGHDVLTQLTYFKTIWEQHGGSDIATRWRPQYTSDMYMLSRSLLDLLAGYGTSWSFDVTHPVELISNEIQGVASSLQEGSDDEAIVHGDTAYRLTRELISFLESRKT